MALIKVDGELREIVPGFLLKRDKDLCELTEALKRDDYAIIEKIGHRVSGSAGGYGFTELGNIARKIEKSVKDQNYTQLSGLIHEYSEHLKHVEVVFV